LIYLFTELRQELAIWQKAASSLSSYSKEEGVVRDKLLRKCKNIFSELKDTLKGFKVDILPTERYMKVFLNNILQVLINKKLFKNNNIEQTQRLNIRYFFN